MYFHVKVIVLKLVIATLVNPGLIAPMKKKNLGGLPIGLIIGLLFMSCFYWFIISCYCVLFHSSYIILCFFLQVKPALPALARLIHSNDEEVLTDACWALSYLSDGTNDKIQAVIEAGVCPRLVELLLWVLCFSNMAMQKYMLPCSF